MKRSRLVPCLLALATLLGAVPVLADGSGSGSGKKKGSDDSSSSDSGDKSAFKDAISDGTSKYAARDFAGAVGAFQKAIEASPKDPLGHYFLGEAQLAANNLTEAEAAWNRASLAATEKQAGLRAKVLFCLADLKERQKKWDDAKAAWQVYLDWVAKYPESKGYQGSGTARQTAIDTSQKQDKAYDVVRQRIASTKNGGVFTDLSKSPPGGAAPAGSGAPGGQ